MFLSFCCEGTGGSSFMSLNPSHVDSDSGLSFYVFAYGYWEYINHIPPGWSYCTLDWCCLLPREEDTPQLCNTNTLDN